MREVTQRGQRLIFLIEQKNVGFQNPEQHKLWEKREGAKAGLTAASDIVLLFHYQRKSSH